MKNEMKRSFLFIVVLAVLAAPQYARCFTTEPQRPLTDTAFEPEKEKKIDEIAGLAVQEAFEALKGVEFLVDESLSHKAISRAFGHRKADAIAYAAGRLSETPFRKVNRKLKRANDDYYVARKIFEVFPEEAAPVILPLYEKSDAITKGNIIRAAGSMAAGKPVRDLLVSALDDTSLYETDNPEASGQPLRICDIAYNQLVLRYKIGDVLRTIGTGQRPAVRDHHIAILKTRLDF